MDFKATSTQHRSTIISSWTLKMKTGERTIIMSLDQNFTVLQRNKIVYANTPRTSMMMCWSSICRMIQLHNFPWNHFARHAKYDEWYLRFAHFISLLSNIDVISFIDERFKHDHGWILDVVQRTQRTKVLAFYVDPRIDFRHMLQTVYLENRLVQHQLRWIEAWNKRWCTMELVRYFTGCTVSINFWYKLGVPHSR